MPTFRQVNYCKRCGVAIPLDKWWLCEECDKKQPNKPNI